MNGPRAHAVSFKRRHGYPEVEGLPDDMFFEIPDVRPNVVSFDKAYTKLFQDLEESFDGVDEAIFAGLMATRQTENTVWDSHDEEKLLEILHKDQASLTHNHQKSKKCDDPGLSRGDIFDLKNDDKRETSRNQQKFESNENSRNIQNTVDSRESTVAERATENIVPKRREDCPKEKKKKSKIIEKDKRRLKRLEQAAPLKVSDEVCSWQETRAEDRKLCKEGHNDIYFQNEDSDVDRTKIDSNNCKELECQIFERRRRVKSSPENHHRIEDTGDECNNAIEVDKSLYDSHGSPRRFSAFSDRDRKELKGIRVVSGEGIKPRIRRASKPKRVGFKGVSSSADSEGLHRLAGYRRRDSNKSNIVDDSGKKPKVRIRMHDVTHGDRDVGEETPAAADVNLKKSDSVQEQGWSRVRAFVQLSRPSRIKKDDKQVAAPAYDFDGVFHDPPPVGDLSTFDFEHITKGKVDLDHIQIEYKHLCQRARVRPVGYILRNLSSTVLRLQSMSLGEQRIKLMCCALLSHAHLRTLEISEDNINSQTMVYIIDVIQENWVIENLLLHDNMMGRQPVKILLNFLMRCDQLVSLTLGGNCLEDTDGVMITDYLGMTLHLAVLDLSHNRLGLQSAELLSKVLAKNTTIHTLSLRWNHMSGRATETFLRCLLKNKTLVNLDMSWNGFEVASVETLTKALRVNHVLCSLDISACRIRGEQLLTIIGAIKKNTALRHLTIGNNIFSCHKVMEALLDLSNFKGEIALKEMDFMDIPVLPPVKDIAIDLMNQKDLIVMYGQVIGRFEGKETDEDILATLNPSTILKEFANLMGMTLEVLFEYMDEDGDQTLSRDEIKEALRRFGIPIPQRSLDLLIRQMDRDSDGVISLQELLGYDKQSHRSRIADVLYSIERGVTGEETGGNQCRKILQRMLANAKKPAPEPSVSESDEEEYVVEVKEEEKEGDEEERDKDEKEDGNNSYNGRRFSWGSRMVKLPPIHVNNKVNG